MKKSVIAVAVAALSFNATSDELTNTEKGWIAAGVTGAAAVGIALVSGSSNSSDKGDDVLDHDNLPSFPEDEGATPDFPNYPEVEKPIEDDASPEWGVPEKPPVDDKLPEADNTPTGPEDEGNKPTPPKPEEPEFPGGNLPEFDETPDWGIDTPWWSDLDAETVSTPAGLKLQIKVDGTTYRIDLEGKNKGNIQSGGEVVGNVSDMHRGGFFVHMEDGSTLIVTKDGVHNDNGLYKNKEGNLVLVQDGKQNGLINTESGDIFYDGNKVGEIGDGTIKYVIKNIDRSKLQAAKAKIQQRLK